MSADRRPGEGLDALAARFTRRAFERGRSLLDSGALVPDPAAPHVWVVRGRSTDRTYRVQYNAEWNWLTCTCPHGLHAGSETSCYHAAAALLTLIKERDT